ncbi:MAG: hypothetical protein GY760_08925 [Deltaproteobacteria bacterium]|nr:hypothetical protein [Deltaproteobacteria bacterium]
MSINMNKKKPILLAFLIFTAVFLSMNITHGKKIQVDSLVLNKADVNKLVGQIEFDPLKKRYIVDDKIITTNIDYKLQKIIEIELKSKQRLNRGKPLEVVIRAIDPNSGNVLLAANFVKDKPVKFTTLYPAASLFKIISAAAIIDKYGYKANTPFYYNGEVIRYTNHS